MQYQVKPQSLRQPQVHKFGGSSLANAGRFAAVADIITKLDATQPVWVVVSAPGDTTDALLGIIASASQQDALQLAISRLQLQLAELVEQSLPAEQAGPVLGQLAAWLSEIPGALDAGHTNDVLAIGERLSTVLLSAVLQQKGWSAAAIDARDFLRLKQHQPQWQQSEQLLQLKQQEVAIHVVTGYIARDDKGHSITLGRNGSDYSATLLGALLKAASVTIWTDVKAIYSADPRKVPDALPYCEVSWAQACQLAQLGNPVLHARTLSPLTGTNTALIVRSSYQPEFAGCKVVQQEAQRQGFVTELTDVTLLTLHQHSRISAAELALELQQPVIALPQQGDNLSWLLPAANAEAALAFLAQHDINAVWDTQSYYALAYLKPHTKAQTEQVESELQRLGLQHRYENAQQVIWLLQQPLTPALLAQLHQQLLQARPVLKVVVAGAGNVGAEFLSMLQQQQVRLSDQVQLQLAGVLNSRQAALSETLTVADWQAALANGSSWSAESLTAYLQTLNGAKVLVDITPSREFARLYPAFIAAGCDIISANKQGVTLPGLEYQQIKQSLTQYQRSWLSNTTCGAGIPIQRTLQELRSAGDEITQVSGIFSGTLSWLLCKYDGSAPFSEFVLQAQQGGLTEPDPRDDLSGADVQRKLLVLARELDLPLELEQITLQPLLPAGLELGSWQDFWAQRDKLDALVAARYQQAKADGKVLRYVASLTLDNSNIQANVALQSVSADHALAAIAPCDNVFVICSNWYSDNPLVLKGPGAGRVVTAGGLHADLAVLIKQLVSHAVQPVALTNKEES